ncbi:MAG: SAM-dependent methyltransferase, partial [Methylococcaceae bacterium]|nr:SAM-dependent methyltransferase [Methylococcaceae bacterium]
MALRLKDVDQSKLEQLQGKVINDVAGSLGLLLAYLGDKLDLYSA